MQSLALAWLAQTVSGRAGAAQLGELQALLQKAQGGQGQGGGMLQMPSEPTAMAQRPTDAAEPMMKCFARLAEVKCKAVAAEAAAEGGGERGVR